jgi:VWFA-related protein
MKHLRRLAHCFAPSLTALLCLSVALAGQAQQNEQASPQAHSSTGAVTTPTEPVLTTRSTLVIVPVLVKTKNNEDVFSLTANDFRLTDDGVPQDLHMEPDINLQPLALAVIVETGGEGASHLKDYRGLGAVLDAVIGAVPHRVAVITFDSAPHLVRDFSPDTDAAAETLASLPAGDHGAAILDAVIFGIKQLSKQPAEYRRAVVLLSETVDNRSQASLDAAVRAVDDTNTSIYSFGFSTTQQAVKHEASKFPVPSAVNGVPLPDRDTGYANQPYAPGGCMDRNSDPDANGNRGVQALDCASDVLPPLRLARMAFLAAEDGLRSDVPRSVAQLTGGEYFGFKDAASLSRALLDASNDLPNYYILSFRPTTPEPGMHFLRVRVNDKRKLQLNARRAYWVDGP